MSKGEARQNRSDLLGLGNRHARKIEDIARLEIAESVSTEMAVN
jgi:hypothetical protein